MPFRTTLNFCSSKDLVKKKKRQTIEREKSLQTTYLTKYLYLEYIKNTQILTLNKHMNNKIRKWIKVTNRHFSEGCIQLANKQWWCDCVFLIFIFLNIDWSSAVGRIMTPVSKKACPNLWKLWICYITQHWGIKIALNWFWDREITLGYLYDPVSSQGSTGVARVWMSERGNVRKTWGAIAGYRQGKWHDL